MTKTKKKRFICDLIDSVKRELISKVDQMPDDWDGHELRELIAEKFEHERGAVLYVRRRDPRSTFTVRLADRARRKKYERERLALRRAEP